MADTTDYDKLVTDAYASIGRTGVGENVSNIDQGGLDYWKGQLASGALSSDNFNSAFNNAVTQYKTANPDDAYTQYVNNYQASHSAPVTWDAPELQPIEGRGHNSWFNPNTGQTYIGKDAAEAANAELLTPSKKTALETAWSNAEKTGDYTNVKDLIGQTGVSGFDLNNMLGLTPEQQQDITKKTGFDFVAPTIKDYQGTEYDTKTLMNLANQLGQTLDVKNLSGGVYGEDRANIGFDPNEYERATGMKANSVSQVLLDAARGLVQQGVTDLSQLKQGDIKSTVNVRAATDENGLPTGKYVASWADQYGDTQSRELTPEEAARITKTTVDSGEGNPYEAMTLADAVTGKGLYYGDKLLSNDPTFLSAGQTYSGPGYTSYSVVYDEQGKPHFKTTGGSSSDMGWIQPILTAGSVIPNPYQPYFQAANAAIQLDQGNTKGALMNAGLSYAGFQDASAADSALSGVDLGNATNTAAITAAQNAANARLAVGAMSAYDAAQKGNYTPLLTLGANVSGSPEVTTALNTMSAANAVANKDLAGAFTAAGNLTKSPDLVLAGSATRFINAVNSGDQNAIIVAGAAFGQAADANAKQSGAAKTVFDAISGGAKAVDTSGLQQGSTITPEGPGTKTSEVTGVDVTDLSKGVQVAGPGGLDQGGFKPGTPTQTATGMFFTTPDGKTYPVTVNKETGMMTSTDPAGAEAVKQFKINDTSGIKDIFFDKTPLNPNLSTSETEALKKVTGKSSGDITDVEAKNASPEVKQQAEDLGNTLLEKIKGGASMGDMLRMIGGLDTAENATAMYLAKQMPELRAIMDNAQNSGYVRELGDNLAIDPTNTDWLQEYKGLTGKDYTIPDMGEIIITGSRPVNEDGTSEGAGDVTDTFTNPYNGITSTTQVDAKTGAQTVTEVDPRTNTTTQTTTTPDIVTEIVTDLSTNTVTKTVTDTKTNTTTTVKIDTKTGGVTVVPSDGGTKTDTGAKTDTGTKTDTVTSTPTSTKQIFGGGPVDLGKPSFLPPEPTRFHKIGEDFKPLNPTLFALAGINPLEGTLEEAISKKEHQPKNTMPTLAELMFAPSSNPVAGPTTQQSAGLMPLPIAQDSGDGTASQPQTAAPAEPPDMVIPAYAQGGLTGLHPAGQPQFYSQGGLGNMHVQGDGDGTSDSVPAMVAKDEFVLPADVVSSLGNGSSEAGASVLDHFVEIIRQHKHSNKPSELPPESKGPLEYLASAMKKGHM